MPYVPPKSLQFKPAEIPAPIKARTHLAKAEEVKEPHFQYLELWKAFEILYKEQTKAQTKLLANRHGGRAAAELDLMGGLITTLSRPRVEQLLAHPDIPLLHAALCRKNMKKLLGDNELLAENGMNDAAWQHARKDLTFNLKANYWKAGEALARLLYIVRGAADPKIRKTDNLVSDVEILKLAYNVLRLLMRTLTEQIAETNETFLSVGDRTKKATAIQAARGKKA